jgi:hypothetical protein
VGHQQRMSRVPGSPLKDQFCTLCQRRLQGTSYHLVNNALLKMLNEIPSYREAKLEIGARVCCSHFRQHDNCSTAGNLIPIPYVGAYEHWEMLPPVTRKRKLPSESSSTVASSSTTSFNLGFGSWIYSLRSFSYDLFQWNRPEKRKLTADKEAAISGDSLIQVFHPHSVPAPPTSVMVGHVMIDGNHDPERLTMDRMRRENESIREELTLANRKIQDLERVVEASTQAITEKDDQLQQFQREYALNQSFFGAIWNEYEEKRLAKQVPHPEARIVEEFAEFSRFWTGLEDADEIINEIIEKWTRDARGKTSALKREQWVLLFLIWLRQGFTKKMLAMMCGQNRSAVTKKMNKILESLSEWTAEQIQLPSLEEWIASTTPAFKEKFPNIASFFIDGTFVPIFKPYNNEMQKKAYNGKHRLHSWVFSILVTCDGRIVWLSRPELGNQHDATAWNIDTGVNKLRDKYATISTTYPKSPATPQLIIGGDKAYPRIRLPGGWKVVLTKTAKDAVGGIERVEAEAIANLRPPNMNAASILQAEGTSSVISSGIAEFRSIVERTFQVVKRWNILQSKFATSVMTKDKFKNIITIICAFTNRSIAASLRRQELAE